MTVNAQLADGRILEFPDGTDPAVIQNTVKRLLSQPAPQATPAPAPTPEPQASIPERILGGVEAAASVASGIPAEIGAGLSGAATTALTGDPQAGEAVIKGVRESLTFEPRTKEGRENLQSLAKTIQPVADLLAQAEKISGDVGFDLAGPVGGAIGASLPTAMAELLGLKGARSTKRLAQAVPEEAAAEVLESGRRLDVPVLTTDVQPPTTFIGKHTQQLSEKLGPLGSGTARSSQQVARQNVVEGLAKEFNVDLDSPFASEIVQSLNTKSARVLEKASVQRNRAVSSLNKFGVVPVKKTVDIIDDEIAKQVRLGDKGNTNLVSNLESIKSSIVGDFSLVKDIRTEVIDDLKALGRGEDRRATGSLQRVKSAIDQDMVAFARTHDRDAAADWLRSNRAFAEELTKTRQTELKRILNTGDATPENVLKIMKAGKPSELKRLNSSLTPKGQSSARAAIVRDALDESGFFRGDVNPDRLATALGKTNRKQAIDAFFDPQDKKQLDGLVKLLNATRRAQQASAAPPTGIQTIPGLAAGGVGFGVASNPLLTLGTVGTVSLAAKAYESKAVRSLLLKIANSKPGSKIETGLLEAAVPSVLAGLQAAKAGQEQTELER